MNKTTIRAKKREEILSLWNFSSGKCIVKNFLRVLCKETSICPVDTYSLSVSEVVKSRNMCNLQAKQLTNNFVITVSDLMNIVPIDLDHLMI